MNIFKERRKKIQNSILDKSIVVLYSGSIIKQSEDNDYEYFTNRNFFYLSNISQDNSLLLLTNKDEYLFIDEFNPLKEAWFGRKLTVNEAKSASNVSNVLLNNDFIKTLDSIVSNGIKNIYLDFKINEKIINAIKDKYYDLNIIDINTVLTKMRVTKDESEINDIKKAIEITHLGLLKVVDELKTAHNEFEIYNAFNHEVLNYGTHELAFHSIIASGIHTCCLHYPTPYDKLDKEGLILCDVGAAYNHYSSDITRTFPVSGKFTDYQRKVYEIVLGCNKEVIKHIKPGLTLRDLQEIAKEYLANECLKAGIIKDKLDINKYYFHSVSHSLGLDTHDVGGRDLTLIPGMILTVEPGLYILEKKTGVRIEDDVLVTKNGYEVLSINIPKEIKDIEKLF